MTQLPFDADCIIVGSGPAGVSAAFPLVEAGVRVLMIDGGRRDETLDDGAPWKRMLGSGLEALLPEDGLSPKLRTPAARQIVSDFVRATGVRGEGFLVVGARTRGGLSRIWGGFVCEFEATDFAGWPFSVDDIRPSYRSVTERVGVSGSADDDMAEFYGRSGAILPPLPVGLAATHLLRRYRTASPEPGFALGLARNAILTVDRGERLACDLRNTCLWGCARGAVYDARFDLATLVRSRSFLLADDTFAQRIAPVTGGWKLSTQNGRQLAAPRIVLAAGALGTTALALPLLPNVPLELRLLSSPVLAMPLLVPARLGRPAPEAGFSLAQLGYRLHYGKEAANLVSGALYDLFALPPASFVARLPLGRRAGTEFFNAIAPALLVATGYFHSSCSDNRMRWMRDGEKVAIVIRGGVSADLPARVDEVIRRLSRIWRRLGAWALPGTSLDAPGADCHYAGPFAMGQTAGWCSAWGELRVAPGVFIVDAAALPSLPPKYPTLTIMANADRIGRHIARSRAAL